ncbi:MAG TPA: branched-chain amino acid ABC transporter substrate-binding protein [Chloroflexia bacterium]|nr:branched-chain amino acid ABC transporter substrate-binding protein [Chloroflexia bacterium]
MRETRYTIDGDFCTFWQNNGGLSVFGYPLNSPQNKYYETLHQTYTVQYFERARFELHPENMPPYNILLGSLGRQLHPGAGDAPEVGAQAGCRWFAPTAFNVCNQDRDQGIQAYWESHGLLDPGLNPYQRSVALWGYPISRAQMERAGDGHEYLTQWFERARLEWHPENLPPYRVEGGLLGVDVYRQENGVVKLAVDLPVGGAEGANGIPTREGIQLAIDQANATGGVTLDGTQCQIQMFFLDDVPPGALTHDPDKGAKNADTFIADPDVMAMVGPFNSSVARAMMPKLNMADLANISPANTATALTLPAFNPHLTDLRPTGKITYFRVSTTDNIQGPVGADYAYDQLGKRKAYILDDTEIDGQSLADAFAKEFQARGGTVLGHDGVPPGTTDFSAIMSHIAATGPDILYYGGSASNNIPLARKAMTPAGLNIPLMGGDDIVESGPTTAAGADAEGDYGTVASVNVNLLPDAKSFIDAYKVAYASAQWQGVPQAYSANAYDATNIIIAAMKTAGKKDREAVRAAIAGTKDFKGATGTTSFDQNGDTTNRWISIYQVQNGVWTFIDQQQFGTK